MKKLIFITLIFGATLLFGRFEFCQYEGQRDINSYYKKCYYSCSQGTITINKKIIEFCPASITLTCDYTGACHLM